MKRKLQVGDVIGRWTILLLDNGVEPPHRTSLCRCSCGTERAVKTYRLRRTKRDTGSCGCLRRDLLRARRGPQTSNWKGGRKVTKEGYIFILRRDHPNANTEGYVQEHVCVMSERRGRPLVKGETVHHLNGVRDDNRIENLELWSSNHPAGQRAEDKIKWALETLALYRNLSDNRPVHHWLLEK